MVTTRDAADLEAQLRTLYADRALLFATFGTADADALIALVRSLEAQLADLYAERQAGFDPKLVAARTHHAPQTTE